jgi:hypothetical protein
MIYYVRPGPWSDTVEDAIIGATERLAETRRSGR